MTLTTTERIATPSLSAGMAKAPLACASAPELDSWPTRRAAVTGNDVASLVRDATYLANYDLACRIDPRGPRQIAYRSPAGSVDSFTSLVLLRWRPDLYPARWYRPLLCVIMTEADLADRSAAAWAAVRAARAHASARRWECRVLTERHLRTAWLDNAHFLTARRQLPRHWPAEQVVLRALSEVGRCTIVELLSASLILAEATPSADDGTAPIRYTDLLRSVCQLIDRERVHADLSTLLGPATRVTSAQSPRERTSEIRQRWRATYGIAPAFTVARKHGYGPDDVPTTDTDG